MSKKSIRKPVLFLLIGSVLFLQTAYEPLAVSGQARSGKRTASSAVAVEGGFSIGVAMSPEGGKAREVIKINVASGAGSFVAGIGGMSLRDATDGTRMTVKNPQGRPAEQVIQKLSFDKAMESGLTKWARDVRGKSRMNPAQLNEAAVDKILKDFPMPAQLKSQVNAFSQRMRQTPNLGIVGRDKSGKLVGMVILNPTPGQWSVEVESQTGSKPYQVVASSIPRQGVPRNIDAIGQRIVKRLNQDFPRRQRRLRWGCDRCCWCKNLAGIGICVAAATAIVAGSYWAAAGVVTVALLKAGALLVSQYALYLWLAWKVPSPPGSVWDIVYGGIMDSLVGYACKLARCC